MKTSDITVVFQGALKGYTQRDTPSFVDVVRQTRKVLPGAKMVLSTWEGTEIPSAVALDKVLMSADPGPLAPLKLIDTKANNINRQIVTTQAGVRAAQTPYTLKLRTDTFLEHAGFIDFYETQLRRDGRDRRIVTSAFFTLDPAVFERIPYHVSDWFQFGLTKVLQAYWNAPFMSAEAGRYYETRPHPKDSNVFERQFRCQFAVEQHICMHYAQTLGYQAPARLNDTSGLVMGDYRRFLADEVMVLDPWQSGVVFSKYRWTHDSVLQGINNVMHLDWLAISGQPGLEGHDGNSGDLARAIAKRRRLKSISQWLFEISSPLHGIIFEHSPKGRFIRRQAMRVFRALRGVVRA